MPQPLTSKDRKRLKQINREIGKLTDEAQDILLASSEQSAGYLYLSTLDFDGVDGGAFGEAQLLANMLATIGNEQSSLHGAILMAALHLSKKPQATTVFAGTHTKD